MLQAEYANNTTRDTGAAQFAIGPSGLLFFAVGGVYPVLSPPMLRISPQGRVETLGVSGGSPRVSPDGNLLAFHRDRDLWVLDLRRGSADPLPLEGAQWAWFAWSHDSRRLVFASDHEGPWSLYSRAVDGSDEPLLVLKTGRPLTPGSWSRNGWLTYLDVEADIWVARIAADGEAVEPSLFLGTEAVERFPVMSPDERWIAYASDKTDNSEIYVRPFPAGEPERRVSVDGGIEPLWSSDGRRLYFRQGPFRERMMVAELQSGEAAELSTPTTLFERDGLATSNPVTAYSVDADGYFYMAGRASPEPQPATAIDIVLDWRRLVDGFEP